MTASSYWRVEGTVIPEFPSGYAGGGVVKAHGATSGASSAATTLPYGGSVNTKGSYVELTPSTEFDANWIEVEVGGMLSTYSYLVDFAIGSATEEVIVPNILAKGRNAGAGGGCFSFPCFIPRGSRITARQASSGVNGTIDTSVRLVSGSLQSGSPGPSKVSEYGAETASSGGRDVDPGGVANTDGSWVEFTSATDRDHNMLTLGAGWFGDLVMGAGATWRAQVGIGGSGAEEVLIPDLHYWADQSTDLVNQLVRLFPIFIPKGSRLSMRCRSNLIDATDRIARFILYGAG